MAQLWSEETKLATWVDVERLACEGHTKLGVISREELEDIRLGTVPKLQRVHELELVTNHDVLAFLTAYMETIPSDAARWVHHGMTSSDLVDTAQGALLAQACDLVLAKVDRLIEVLKRRALEHWSTLCVGRTHGVHAEPTTFGHKLGQFALATDRSRTRLRAARYDVAVGSISGAVGTYSNIDPFVEGYVCDRLGLAIEPVPTQVVARDRHAALLSALAGLTAVVEQVATEIRHLQRTEVREVEEPFGAGQKGSSAMPHKRNPILSERLCGLARVVRATAVVGLENVALWHERDISHSSAERVVLPDALTATDYQVHLAARVIEGLRIFPDRMRANLDATSGLLASSRVLLAVVETGMARDDAYRLVQAAALRAWENGTQFRAELADEGVTAPAEAFEYEAFLSRHEVVRERLESIKA
ncbi:MAG: adenylosuccinate lyase [Egibacteraceae bacterium]